MMLAAAVSWLIAIAAAIALGRHVLDWCDEPWGEPDPWRPEWERRGTWDR